MRIILLIVFYIATCVARIAVGGDIAKTMPGRSMRYSLKSGTARSGISEMPIDDGIIQIINKRNGQSSLGNRIDGFPQRRNNLKRVGRSLRKRKKCAKKNSDCRNARRRNNYVDDDDIDEQNTPSNVMRFPVWQIPESTVPANNLDSTMIMRTETNNRSLLAFERPQLKNLDYSRSETIFPIVKRHPNSPRLLDINVKDLILSKVANPKSEIIDVQSPTFEGLNNKMQPAYRPGILTGVDSNYPQGFQQQYERNVHQRDSSNNNVKEELFDDPPVGSNERFLLVPVFKNLYVLKDIQESPRTDRIIVPKRYKPLERDNDNATSAILSFKAHMHHDVKDVGRAYLQRGNHRLFDHNANYLYSTLDPRVSEETATENPASYPDFLYPGIAFQTRSNLIDATPEISDEQMVSPVPDYASISFADINLRGGINSYDSSAFLSSSSSSIPNYDIPSKENANDRDQPRILSATKLDDEINLPQDSGNSFGYSKLTTTNFRDIFDHNVYKPVTFEMYLTNDKEVSDVSQNLEDESKFSTGRNEDKSVADLIDNISQYRATFDTPANEDNTFFPNITYTFVNNAEGGFNSEDIGKDIGQEYGITIAGKYSNKKTTYSNDFDNNNRSDEALLSNNATDVDLFLNAEDYVTAATLFPNTDEWPLKKAQSNVENSHVLLMAIKPLSSELQKLLSAVKLVNQSLSDVQNRLCDKKNIIRTERESKDGKATNIAKLTNKDRYDSDFFTESLSSQSLNKRRFKTKNESVTERDVKIRRETNDLFLNKLTTPFHKRESSISNSEVQSGRRNKKRKLNEREFPKSGDVGRRRLSRSRFNRNLKSLTKSYEMRVTPIRQFIEAGLKKMKRTTTPITRSRFIKSDVSGKNNFAGGRAQNYQGNNQSRSIISNNTPSTFLDIFTKDNSAHLLSEKQDLQRDLKRAMSNEISGSDKEKKFSPINRQFYKEATAYLDILKLLSKTEKPHVTDVWTTQSLTESLPPLIFTTTGFSVSALTFLPYFTEESTITTLSTIAEKKEAPVTDFAYKDYENMTSKTSEIISLTQSPVTLSAFTITMPTTLSLFYTTEITILPIDEAAILTTEIITEKMIISVATEVTETPIPTTPTVKNFTTESTMLLTPILEGMTDITLKIKIPAATETSIEEILIKTETMTTEEETVEGTSTTLTTELERIGTFLSTSTEVAITTLIPEDESPVTQIEKTITAEETATEIPTTIETATPTEVAITTTEISTSMETAITEILTINKTLTIALQTSIEASTVSEILTISTTLTTIKASTITETLTPTEILTITLKTPLAKGTTSAKTLTPTETPTSIETKTSIETSTTEISTSIETTTITGILTINKTLTVVETSTFIETSTVSEIPTISTILTTVEATTITKTLTPTEILTTTLKIPTTKGTTSAKTLIPTETLTTKTITEISATTETLTSIKSTTITKILIINKTLTTTETSSEILTASEISTTSAITITTEATTTTEIPTKILTTLKTPITKETTSAKTLTSTETTLTLAETKTTTEMSTSVETTTTTEILTINKTLTTTETSTSIETSTASEIPTTSTISTATETTTITETPTKILTTLKTPITKETTSVKTLTPTETTLTLAETKTTTEMSTSVETTTTTEILTINKTLTTTETPTSIETSTASEIPTTSTISTATETTTITETPTKILTTLKTPITKEPTRAKTLTPIETLTSIETKTTTEISTSEEIIATTEILTTETLTTTETSVFIETSTASEIPTTTEITAITETSTLIEILATTEIPTIKKTMSTKALTPTIMETPLTTETPTITESLETTEIPVISTTYITTKFFTLESTMSLSVAMTSPKEFFPTSILTTFTTIFTETTESILISSTPVTTTFVPTTIPTLKLTTPLQMLITNTTLSETPSTISSTVFTTEKSVITSLKTAVPTTSLKVARPSLITSTMLSETPSTFLIEETTASSILTTSSLETLQTTAVLPIFTTVSTVGTPLTTSSIYTTVNATVSSTTASTITPGIFESTTSPVIHFTVTTPSITKTSITTPVIGTMAYETTSTLATSFFLTETIEVSTTSPREETEEYKEYYESTKEEIAVTSGAEKLITEEYTTWVTEEVTIIRETTPTTYLFTTLSFIETTTEAITLPTTEETEVEKVTVTPVTAIEGISTLSEVTLISTETSTISVIETSSLIPTIAATTALLLEETTTEISETSWITTTLPTTERPEYATILEAAITVTLVPFSESILSILITSETPATTPEVISVLPKTVSEEFTMSTTESPLITYVTKSSTALFAEITTHPAVSILTAITEEAETEYYIAKEPFYEEEYEEYEEYDTEIPTDKWYYYDEYETTKKRTTATVKYTKLLKEKTSPPFLATTSPEIEISEFTRYSTPSEIIPTYTNVISTAATSETSYTKEEVTSTLETSALTIIENVTTVEAKTEVTTSAVNEKTESITFGSTEEYTLPPTTIFKIPTEPLEHLTIPPKYTDLERFTQIWRTVTSRKFITKPKKIPEIVLEKTTVSERVSKETEVAVEKLTSFFVSSVLTTLSEKEAFKVHTTTMSTASSETEATVETGYEITTLAMTEEEIVPRVTPFITSEAEIEVTFTTTNETIEREKQKEQLLRQLDALKQRQREMAEREERLKEKEKQWYTEKEKRRKMMQREKGMSTTEVEVPGLETFITTSSLAELTTVSTETTPFSTTEEITSVTYTTEKTEKATTEGSTSTMYTTEETEETVILYTTELTSIKTPTFYTIKEMYTASYVSETTPSSITEEITSVVYTTEEATTEGSTSMTYTTEEIEETVIPYVTEKSTSTYLTEEIEEVQITDYVTLMPYVTASIMDLFNVGLASIETVTPYTVEEAYTTSYVTLYSETFASSTITSPIITATDKFVTLPIATLSERFEETSIASVTTPTWYTTEETYTVTYTDIYSKFLFTSPTLEFISTTTSSTLAVITTIEVKYDEEIEKLREKLRRKERELEEREKILLEREKRLERDIMEFEKYMAEFEKKETSVFSSEKSTVLTSLSTPMPPTERTTIKAQLTTQIKRVTEKRENKMTTKMVTSRQTEMGEKKRTKHVPEEEIATKRICLNVLENTTIPLDKRRRGITTKKICLPYFPEEKKSVGRLNRRLLALQSARKNRRSRSNVPLEYRCRRRVEETTRKINNLQLLHHEWLSNETTKPLRYFKGFTRIYEKMRKFPKKVATVIDIRGNVTNYFQNKISLYGRRVLDHYEDVFQPTAASMLDGEEHRKRDVFFIYDLTSARKNNFFIGDKTNVRKRDVSLTENNARFWSKKSTVNTSNQRATTATTKNGFYTVNVLHLSYNEDKQTHEVISAKPDEDELRVILSESNGDNYVTEFGEDRKVTTPYYEIEEEDNLKDDKLTDETEQKLEEDEDYIEDMIENYMNYEEHETSTWTHDRKFLDDEGKDKKMTVNEKELLAQTWPTEKSTTYHLGGTKFWELEFVTEPSVSRTTIDKGKTINVSITRTTCLDVVLKNERNSEVKSNISYHKRDIYSNRRRKRKDVSIEKRNASLRNVTRKNALRYKLRTQRSRKKLKRDSSKLHDLSYSKRGFEEGMRAIHFQRTSNEDSITAKSRKLCGVNASKLKRQIANHEDKRKKKQPTKSRTLQNINLHSLHNTDNCVVNKKSKHHKTTTTTANPQIKKPDDKKKDEKIVHLNKNKSTMHERKVHNCLSCICDIANIVNNIKSLLDRVNFPLDEIKALNCSEYKEIQDKIVMSMDSDVEEAREFPQPHYNIESLKGQKYIKLEELEDNFKSDSELDSDHDVVSLPGLNLNLPCNQDGDGITWLSSVSRPSYTWKRTDGIALFGFVTENGDLELRNVNAKDTGNYTCVMTYMNPDNEEPVETAYEIHLQVVTLPRYVVHGESRYHVRSCDERDLDVLVTYLPLKLNSVICEADVCNAYVLTPSCSRSQITVNVLLVPSHIVKLMTIDPKHCNVFCLKAIQDKLSLVLSKNLQIFLGKTIIFRLPHYEQRLVPIVERSSFARQKRGKTDANGFAGGSSNVGLFSSCPAGYGLRDTRCVPCNMGTYSEDGISHCKRCPPGTYQPHHGARVCRTCTNPMTKGCYNMLWNSFSAIMVTLASIGAMLSICFLLLWIICCAKKKFCVKRIAGIAAKEDAFKLEKRVEEQSLIKDASENEDQQWDSEYRVKKKKGKFYVNKKRRKQNERRKYDKTHEDEWGSHRIKNPPIICPDSYQSHEDYNNYYPKQSYRKGPRLPECDFDT